VTEIRPRRDGAGLRVAVVAARFNELITEPLLAGALDTLRSHGVAEGDLWVVRVPGAFELPLFAQRLAASGRVDAVVALAAVVRGETPHFDLVAGEAAHGLAEAARTTGVPVAFGVITADTPEQAMARVGLKQGHKGREAAAAALEAAQALRELERMLS
jgi:6,7-dimethyl-8-ribityllumazine synthase